MDPRERADDASAAMSVALDGMRASLWTSIPVKIVSYDAAKQTCTAQPLIQAVQTAEDGTETAVNLPLLLDCPIEFPGGGGATLTFPVQVGDEGLAVFSARCIDAWHQQGDVQPQAIRRMHDLSDAVVHVGVRSQPRALTNVSTTAVQLRSDDHATLIELNPTAQTITMTAPGGITITGDITHTGKLTSSGIIKSLSDVLAKTISLFSHKHNVAGVQAGGATILSDEPS